MKFMYFFDDKIKRHIMKGKKYCNPAETGNYECGISCIRQGDVNLWFYTKNGVTIAVDSGHLNYRGVENSFQQIGINPEEIKHVFILMPMWIIVVELTQAEQIYTQMHKCTWGKRKAHT